MPTLIIVQLTNGRLYKSVSISINNTRAIERHLSTGKIYELNAIIGQLCEWRVMPN